MQVALNALYRSFFNGRPGIVLSKLVFRWYKLIQFDQTFLLISFIMFLRNSWIYVKVTSFLSNVMFAPVNFFRLLYFILVFVSSSFSISLTLYSVQKQLPDVFFRKGVLKHFLNIHRKMPVLKTRFNKIGGLQACNFIERRNIAKFLSTFYFEERI